MEIINTELNKYDPGSDWVGTDWAHSDIFEKLYVQCNQYYLAQIMGIDDIIDLYNGDE